MPILPHRIDSWLGEKVLSAVGRAPIQIVLASGERIVAPGVTPAATVILRDRSTLAELVIDPEVAFGDAYADGRIQIDGDLVRLLEAIYEAWRAAPTCSSIPTDMKTSYFPEMLR